MLPGIRVEETNLMYKHILVNRRMLDTYWPKEEERNEK